MTSAAARGDGAWTVFLIFLRLGCTSFGGPVAHLGYFRDEFVTRRAWLGERAYADLVALCQFLPGPASSQVGMALGLLRAGHKGALAAWLGFTLPSALIMILLALGVSALGTALPAGLLHGLKLVAVAVVAQAVWGMGRALCTDGRRITLMMLSAGVVLAGAPAWAQGLLLLAAAAAGAHFLSATGSQGQETLPAPGGRRSGALWLALFALLLFALPLAARLSGSAAPAMADAFYRAGAQVFGGGHVVLPMLQVEVVPRGWVTADVFLAGYGAAQAVPGPLFTFAAFLGASMSHVPTGWVGGLLCLVFIFLPAYLLVAGALPFWARLRTDARAQAALAGVNAAVVGVLLAALYTPVWTGAVGRAADFAQVLVLMVALMSWKLPPWLVVLVSALLGWAASAV